MSYNTLCHVILECWATFVGLPIINLSKPLYQTLTNSSCIKSKWTTNYSGRNISMTFQTIGSQFINNYIWESSMGLQMLAYHIVNTLWILSFVSTFWHFCWCWSVLYFILFFLVSLLDIHTCSRTCKYFAIQNQNNRKCIHQQHLEDNKLGIVNRRSDNTI